MRRTPSLLFLALSLVCQSGNAQNASPAPLPRVLLIGDSISIGYTKPVQTLLDGRAVVERCKGNAAHSRRGLAKLDEWLGDDTWDVIHFNFGLHDLCYRNANGKGRNKASGLQTHTREQYAENLTAIVKRLQDTSAELIFATTTPVPDGEPGRVVGDDLLYNTTALDVMHAHGVGINDLHGHVASRMEELATKPGNVHFTKKGSRVLAEQVVRSINRALRQRGAEKRAKSTPKPAWQPTRKVVYRTLDDTKLALHIFEPDHHRATDHRAALVFFFGGGWNGGTPAQFYAHCEYLASRGMIAISAEYRVKSRHGTTPFECVEDGKAALRWIRTHAKELGVDPTRIAAGGGSAGGHVAAAVAMVRGFEASDETVTSRPDALVLFNPVYDNGPGGYGHARVKARFREISPAHNIRSGVPPAIVFLGTKDTLVPVQTAESFRDAMRAAGSRSELVLFDGRPHGFFNHGRGDGTDYKDSVRAMDRFLASLGFLTGTPTLR